jgi:hypothetical protein
LDQPNKLNYQFELFTLVSEAENTSGDHKPSTEIALDSEIGGLLVIPREGLQITF